MSDDIKKTYEAHKFTEDQLSTIAAMRKQFGELDRDLAQITKPSREASLAATHLEIAMMWAIKGIFVNG